MGAWSEFRVVVPCTMPRVFKEVDQENPPVYFYSRKPMEFRFRKYQIEPETCQVVYSCATIHDSVDICKVGKFNSQTGDLTL